jgi:hypothetical protein
MRCRVVAGTHTWNSRPLKTTTTGEVLWLLVGFHRERQRNCLVLESLLLQHPGLQHHAPSRKSVPDPFLKHRVSAAFASNLDDFILDTKPQVLIHGHIHRAVDYTIGHTRVICNPMGYPEEKNTGYTDKLIVEI